MDKNKGIFVVNKYGINTTDKHEIEYWSIKLGVSAQELLQIVDVVGNSSIEVQKHIKANRHEP